MTSTNNNEPTHRETNDAASEVPASLGFTYQKPAIDLEALSAPDTERVCFRARKAFEQIIFDTVKLEGNPYTFPEVKTLLDGVTVGGHKLSDEKQIINQADSWKRLFEKVKDGSFRLDKSTFCELHNIAGEEEALTWGKFRNSHVSIAGTEHRPPKAEELDDIFNEGCEYINGIQNPLEKAMAFFLFGSINQFFFDVNKRTSRLMMNGALLSAGYDVMNIPAKRQLEFNEKMVRFYDSKDGTEMMAFLASCSLDPELTDKMNGDR